MKSLLFLSIFIPLILLSQTFENLELVLEIPDPDAASGAFGIGLASGDLNEDGYSDVVITKHSRVYVYYGGDGMDDQPDVVWEADPRFATYVAVGDIDGNGYDDVIVGQGYIFIYYGGDPMDTLPDLQTSAGSSVASGDLNNDGYDDWIIGRPSINDYIGEVRIYFGGSEPDTIPDVILNGEEVSNFGTRLASGQDVNGDGYEDLFVTAIIYGPYQGKTYIYYGGDPMDTIPDVEMYGTRPFDFFGETISLVPDLEGDGYDEAAVGEPLDATHDTVFTYFGGEPMDDSIDIIFGVKKQSYFGYTVAGQTKGNTDNYGDISIGSPGYGALGPAEETKGKVYFYLGNLPMDTVSDAYVVGIDSQEIGCKVASAGDIDGDGMEEIILSNYASNYSPKKVWVCKYTGTGIEEDNETDNDIFRFIKTYPNPFNDYTKVEYQLGGYVYVSLKVYDVSGRLVKTLVDCRQNPGFYSVRWDGRDNKNNIVSGGVYFCELKVERSKGQRVKRTRKLVYLGH